METLQKLVSFLAPPLSAEHLEASPHIGLTGWRITDANAKSGKARYHPAVDLSHKSSTAVSSLGAPVTSMHQGTVLAVGSDKNYGNYVVVGNGAFSSLYAHLHTVAVNVDETIELGGTLGTLGNSGNSASPHLHVELSVCGIVLDLCEIFPSIKILSAHPYNKEYKELKDADKFGQALMGNTNVSYSKRGGQPIPRENRGNMLRHMITTLVTHSALPSAKYQYTGSLSDYKAASGHISNILAKLSANNLSNNKIPHLSERRASTVTLLDKMSIPQQVKDVLKEAVNNLSANAFLFTLGKVLSETRMYVKGTTDPTESVKAYNLFGIKSQNGVGLKAYDEGSSTFKQYPNANTALRDFVSINLFVYKLDRLGVGLMMAASAAAYYGSSTKLAYAGVKVLMSKEWSEVVTAIAPQLNFTHELIRSQLIVHGTYLAITNRAFSFTEMNDTDWKANEYKNYYAAHVKEDEAKHVGPAYITVDGKRNKYVVRDYFPGIYQLVPEYIFRELQKLKPLPTPKGDTSAKALQAYENAVKKRVDLTADIFKVSLFVYVAVDGGYECKGLCDAVNVASFPLKFESTSGASLGTIRNPLPVKGLGTLPVTSSSQWLFVDQMHKGYQRAFDLSSSSVGLSSSDITDVIELENNDDPSQFDPDSRRVKSKFSENNWDKYRKEKTPITELTASDIMSILENEEADDVSRWDALPATHDQSRPVTNQLLVEELEDLKERAKDVSHVKAMELIERNVVKDPSVLTRNELSKEVGQQEEERIILSAGHTIEKILSKAIGFSFKVGVMAVYSAVSKMAHLLNEAETEKSRAKATLYNEINSKYIRLKDDNRSNDKDPKSK